MSVIVTALQGVERSARVTTARTFGSDTFVVARVFPGQLGRKALIEKLRRNPDVTRSDVRFLERYADGGVIYAPVAQRNADVVAGGRRFENASIGGTASALADLRDVSIERGRFFSTQEEIRASQVAVIGADVADALFPALDPVGRTVRIGRRGYLVIGVQTRQGTSGGASLDRNVWMPLLAWERVFGAPSGLQVFARGTESGRFAEAEDRARSSMRARRALEPGIPDNFDLLAPEAARSFVLNISARISAAGVPISIMAMLAAIVVVTNTILVSVAQRTREIGIRRAVGGSRLHVTIEIVAESAMVAVAGGLAGVIAAAALLGGASGAIGFDLPLQWTTIGWSLAAAVASGMIAAWYPAHRASRFNVVSALHQE
jgi:putative ABC transport system permease protein